MKLVEDSMKTGNLSMRDPTSEDG